MAPEGSKEKNFRSVHCGVFYLLAITEDGKLFGWSMETLMSSDNSGNPYRPRQILVPAPVVLVACGYSSVMAITGSGEVYGWGRNCNGELGMCAKLEKISKPTLYVELTKRGVRSLVCGGSHGLAIVQDGSVLEAPSPYPPLSVSAQLGNRKKEDSFEEFQKVLIPEHVVEVACGAQL
jgi:alpha-tubulin suppressor-like RCC1 family protein